MSTSYTWFADEHRRWVLRAFGGAAAVTVPMEGTPTSEVLAARLWAWLVAEHGPRLERQPLLDVPVVERVALVLVDVRQHTESEAARAMQVQPEELQQRLDHVSDQLRLPPSSRPTCSRWLDLRGVHRLRDDAEHVLAAERHLAECTTCDRAMRDTARRRRWWLARLGHPAAPRRGGVYTVLPAFGDDEEADAPPVGGALLATMHAMDRVRQAEHASSTASTSSP